MIKVLTVSGVEINLENYDPSIIPIEDSVFSLSVARRFGNQGRRFISVAEHQIKAYKLAKYFKFSDLICKLCLIHDFQESAFTDMPNPIKHSGMMDAYVKLEHQAMINVFKYYLGIDHVPEEVKYIDRLLLIWEASYVNEAIYNKLSLEPLNLPGFSSCEEVVEKLNKVFKFHGYEPRVIEKMYLQLFNEVILNDTKRSAVTSQAR